MKKVYPLMVALFLVNGTMAQWFPQNSGTTNNLNSVYFTDLDTGYAVGDSGTILKTTDGGSNWELKTSGTLSNLYSVQFTNPLTGYTVGDNCIILKTIDGGENWSNQSVGVSVDLSSVSFPATDTGYVVGFFWDYQNSDTLYNYILKTNNGGNLWTISYLYKTVDDVGSPRVRSVFFPNVNTGYAVGTIGMDYKPYLLKTTDSGIVWTSQSWDAMCALMSAYFLNPDTGYVVGYGEPNSFRTVNGGNDWMNLTYVDAFFCYSVYFVNADKGYIVGYNLNQAGIVLYTDDGGVNWSTQYTDNVPGRYLISVNFANDTIGFAVGTSGCILKTTNGGGFPVGINDQNQTASTLNIYPNPSSTVITIESPAKSSLSIHNTSGQQILQQQITKPKTTIDVSGWKCGVYLVKVAGEQGVSVGKFIKQ